MASGAIKGEVDVSGMYAQSFGNLPHGEIYHDPANLKGYGDKKEVLKNAYQAGLKAQTVISGGAGTAGYAMVPVFVDPKVIDTTRKYTPLMEIIPRVTNRGMYADYNKITSKGGAASRAEDDALPESNTTYDRASTAIKFFYAVGRVTGPSLAAQPSYILQGLEPAGGAMGSFNDASAANSKQMEVLVKVREMNEYLENTIINGNTSNTSTDFSGFVTLIGTNNTVAKGTTALSLDDIQTALQYAFDDGGRPNLAVCSSAVYTDLLKLLTSKIGYLQAENEVFWGFNTIVLKGFSNTVPVIPSMFMSNTTGSKAIYFLDMSVVELRVLQDIMYQELAMTNDSQKFMLKFYGALIIKNVDFCSSITAIA